MGRTWTLAEDDSGPWADCWSYDGALFPIVRTLGAISYPRDRDLEGAATFDDSVLAATSGRPAGDLDANYTEASICFPTFPRFCGQTFLEASERDLAAACVQAYNDWMIDDWCGGEAYGRLIPFTLVPIWDAGWRPRYSGAPPRAPTRFASRRARPTWGFRLHTEFWEPLWRACEDTSTVVNIHQGSSSTFMTTSRDAPALVPVSLNHVSAERALVDWLSSGIFERYPTVKLVLSEGQAGWMPFLLERMDRTFHLWGQRPGAHQPAAEHLRAGTGLRCDFRGAHRSGHARPDRDESDPVRNGLSACRLHLAPSVEVARAW